MFTATTHRPDHQDGRFCNTECRRCDKEMSRRSAAIIRRDRDPWNGSFATLARLSPAGR